MEKTQPCDMKIGKPEREYEVYLFDADGTLLNTVDLVVESYMHVFVLFKDLIPGNREYSRKDVASLMGIPLQVQMEHYFGSLTADKMEEVCNAYTSYQQNIYKDYLKPFPGVRETLRELKLAGKKCGIVTSRRIGTAGLYAEATGIAEYIDVLITPEDTAKHKPEPEPVLEAMKRLGSSPDNTVFVGDALFDVRSGNAAGVDTVFVNWSHNDVSELEESPTYVIDTMQDLLK